MKKIAYIFVALIAISALLVGDVGARGRGGGGRGEGREREEREREEFRRGRNQERFRPSVNRPAVNRPHPSGQFTQPRGGGYSKPNISDQRRTLNPESFKPQRNIRPETFRPQANPRPESFRPQNNFRSGGGPGPNRDLRFQPGQQWGNRPTQEQVQRFLNLPRNNVGQGRPGLGKVGAAAVGAAAGAVALDQFSNRGRAAGDRASFGHQPVRSDQPSRDINRQRAQQIRDNYSHRYPNTFNRSWWAQHPQLAQYYWHNNIWPHHPWNYWWRPATWIALSSWIVWNWGAPVYYDYGSNFYYDNDYVYFNGSRIASAGQYYDQAARIVSNAPEVNDDAADWMPLGVFALSQGAADTSNVVLQLAVNKEGTIQGTYYNNDNDVTKPIKGVVDKKSQRAVWTFADDSNNAVIMETSIYNLTLDQTEVLVHFGKERTEQWLLVRLPEPPSQEGSSQ